MYIEFICIPNADFIILICRDTKKYEAVHLCDIQVFFDRETKNIKVVPFTEIVVTN